ncbi:hypothetical protein AIC89_004572 [Salmonella enterica subsp. enterica serovar Aberdeen]|uniref:hypothetical protein n=1 Tax=Escherichia sp. E4742 TaxID=2044467 RepID=UPI001081E013|nr:hypothetical protein [Escherichia sp. E4742]EGZ4019285.1 hypothetical protein [Salmonella enterica subsp. enterica serovar Aberdeen]TGB52794.1 hypothetical protein CRI69_26215 [Escherichia sp. E4742]
MGFWDKAFDVAKTVGKAAWEETKAANERAKQYREEVVSLSDRELARIIATERHSTPLRAGAAMAELKRRGYANAEEIKALLR